MRRYSLFCFALALFIVVALLGGCNSSNKEGQPASLSITSGGVSPSANIQAEIRGVTINNRPVVTFKLLDENGLPLDPATPGLTIRFLIAQLQADGNYANYEGATKNADGTTTGAPSYESTTTVNGQGTLATVGNGVYTYTFFRDVKDKTKTLANLVYDPIKTHTVAILAYRTVPAASFGGSFQQVQNVYSTFRPDGQSVTQTREIVATSNCNECHGQLGQKDGSFHGGNRREVALCILCHNPGLKVNSVPFDFKFLVHRIHMGKSLPGNVAAIAAGGNGLAIDSSSFAGIGFPFISGDSQITFRPIECTKCHQAGTDINGRAFGRDAERWRYGMNAAGQVDTTKSAATKENCTTCHDTTSFTAVATADVADATAAVSGTTTSYTPKLTTLTAANGAVAHTGATGANGLPWPDNQCAGCHLVNLAGDNAYKMTITGHHTIFEKSSVFTGLNFQILTVDPNTAKAGLKPKVTFKITDDAGNTVSPAGTGGTPAVNNSFNLKLGYFRQTDYTNEGMASFGQPLSQALAGATANGDGSFTITFGTAIPAGATGIGTVGLEGTKTYNIPATPKKAARNVRTSGDGIQYYFDLATGAQVTDPVKQRRNSVDVDKCNNCHGGSLSLHGGNRKNSISECVICHNPNATDRNQRPVTKDAAGNITAYLNGIDGKFSQTIHFKVLIHRIHTGEDLDLSKAPLTTGGTGYIIYGNGGSINDFSDVTFPRDRRDCLACHIKQDPLVYGVPLPDGVLGTTTLTGATFSGTTPTFAATIQPPTVAACLSCHDNGFDVDHAALHVTGSGAAAVEFCVACHQTGLVQAVDAVHRPVR